MMWNELKEFVMKRFCQDEQELANAIVDFEKTLTPEKCKSYINHLYKVMQIVIDREGGWSDC